jgi:hypothetical protein
MNAPVEAAGDKPRQPDTGRIRSNPFSWWATMNIPTREQTCVRSVGHGWMHFGQAQNHEGKSIRGHSS